MGAESILGQWKEELYVMFLRRVETIEKGKYNEEIYYKEHCLMRRGQVRMKFESRIGWDAGPLGAEDRKC